MKIIKHQFTEQDLKLFQEVLRDANLGFGEWVTHFENDFKSFSGSKHNIATNSASAAAYMIFAFLKDRYGCCDVYTPSLAFTSPAWAAKHFGHNILWVDVNDNLLFDSKDYIKLRSFRKEKTRQVVLMPILYGGVSNIPEWQTFGDEIVVVDSAHCVTPKLKGNFCFFSFHPYKPICSSDGGMISTDDEEADLWFRHYRNFGRSNIEGTYDITQDGFKFYMNNLNALLALISSGKYYRNLSTRRKNYSKLENVLEHDDDSSYYMATRIDPAADAFNSKHNLARHYPMLHKTKYFKSNLCLPNTELLQPQIVNLPLYENLCNS
jgi:dTDP-4-amino-4,6-dideoxygalactose transaminase|tara:strand:+ start:3503 stop:4468 length:966 start_codon:yes stop_codon:yes gene_type:complete